VVRGELERHNLRFDAHEARGPGDAQTTARAAIRAGYSVIAVVGGDGTLSEVAAGFFEDDNGERSMSADFPTPINSQAALAVLPGGTGNDFARALQHERASLSPWVARLLAHLRGEADSPARAIDVLHGRQAAGEQPARRRSFICLNAATLGIGAEVAGRVAAQANTVRRLPGETRFALAALAALLSWRSRRMRITVDDKSFECGTNLVAVVNSAYAGGGMMFSPEAKVDDGLLDVVTACDLSRAAILREITRIHRGGHLANPRVSVRRGVRVLIENLISADALPVEADGDVRGHTPVEFRVMPGALRVVM
ncbi:MAG: hypothetical protein H0T45_03620, partial [Pyrinomonadaceae bacterium]|nr:hypothetical protein [Pyrinomonadaceae bacterium]